MLVYDVEIVKAIQGRGEEREPGIEYCDGWRDFENMGVSVISAYDYETDRYRVFLEDNFGEFEDLAHKSKIVVGFNSSNFDDHVCAANGMPRVKTTWDLLSEIWNAVGLPPAYEDERQKPFSLDAMAYRNLHMGKTGHGALAPVLWQEGKHGTVIDYCLEDTRLTKLLLDRVLFRHYLADPRLDSYSPLAIEPPPYFGYQRRPVWL